MLKFAESASSEHEHLSAALFSHYQATGLSSSLEEAIRISRIRIDMDGRGSPAAFCNLGSILEAKGKRYQEADPAEAMKMIDEAISCGRKALSSSKNLGTSGPHILNMMGAWHATKMKISRDITIGEEGANLLDFAITLRPPTHSNYPLILSNLVHTRELQHQLLIARGQKLAAIEALSKAIDHGYEAVNTTEDGSQHLGERRKHLGAMLFSKHLLTEDDLTLAAKTENASPLVRIPAAIQAGISCWEEGEAPEGNELLQGAVSLLPTISAQSMSA